MSSLGGQSPLPAVPSSNTKFNNAHNFRLLDGIVAILDLPLGSIINIDGTSIVLQRNDFVGIHSIPITSLPYGDVEMNENSMFHLITVRGGNNSKSHSNGGGSSSSSRRKGLTSTTTVGFPILWNQNNNNNNSGQDDHPVIVRMYDPCTEEVSPRLVDDATVNNLLQQMHNYNIQMDPHRFISYRDIVADESSDPSVCRGSWWYQTTNFITNDFLQYRKLPNGIKIVPGSYDDNDNNRSTGNENNNTHYNNINDNNIDGISINYPPIPVLRNTTDANDTNYNGTGTKNSSTIRTAIHQHIGTRRFLLSLSPSLRTSLYSRSCANSSIGSTTTASSPPNIVALGYIIETNYENKWEYLFGDLQLSFVLFLHLHCYTSWTNWRDVIAMLSSVDTNGMQQRSDMYEALFQTLSVQLQSIDDEELLNDIDLSDDDCFLLPSLHQLLLIASNVVDASSTNRNSFAASFYKLIATVQTKFPSHFSTTNTTMTDINDHCANSNTNVIPMVESDQNNANRTQEEEEEDDDEPVFVSTEEIEESLERSKEYMNELNRHHPPYHSIALMEQHDHREWIRQRYPLLLAAMDSSIGCKEDIVMTCARILYDAVDVSLVREAAAYLEEVEEIKKGDAELQ